VLNLHYKWESGNDRDRKGTFEMAKPLIDINQLSRELNVAPKTIRNRLSNKSWPIPPIRIGRTLRWRQSDITRALTMLTDEPESKGQDRLHGKQRSMSLGKRS